MSDSETKIEDGVIRVVCCACGEHVGDKSAQGSPSSVSHGYCDECFADVVEGLEAESGMSFDTDQSSSASFAETSGSISNSVPT